MSIQLPANYYDQATEGSNAYKMVAFNPKVPCQARELNSLQQYLQDQVKLNADQIFSNGQIANGCNLTLGFNNDGTIALGISSGTLYANGYWHSVPATNITIAGTGKVIVSLQLNILITTSTQDATLLDPVSGAEAYGKSGADRASFTYTYNTLGNGVPIWTFQDGQLVANPPNNSFLDLILAILAQRTNEQSGSFTVKLPQIALSDPTDVTDQHIIMDITNGIGYIQGYRRDNTQARLYIRRPLDGASRIGEQVSYSSSTKVYTLNVVPYTQVTNILAKLNSGNISMNRSGTAYSSVDNIPLSSTYSIDDIVSISDVGHGTYTANTDYKLVSNGFGQAVQWQAGGSQPSSGSTYTLVVEYNKNIVKAVRTSTSISAESHTISGSTTTLAHTDVRSINAITIGGVAQVQGTNFTVALNTGVITWIGSPSGTALVSYTYWAHTVEGDYVSRDSFVDSNGNIQYDSTPIKTPTGVTVDFTKQISFDTVANTPDTHPVNGSVPTVNYTYTLPRTDVLAWGQDGVFTILEGAPALNPTLPSISDFYLPITQIIMQPEARWASGGITLQKYDNQTLLVTEQRSIAHRLSNVEYNLAQFQLQTDMANSGSVTDKLGIFADNLSTPDYVNTGDAGYGGTFDYYARTFGLPRTQYSISNPTMTSSAVTANAATLKVDQWFPTYTENVGTISQLGSNQARSINKYGSLNYAAKVASSATYTTAISPTIFTTTTQYGTTTSAQKAVANAKLTTSTTKASPLASKAGVDTATTGTQYYETKVPTDQGWVDVITDANGNPLSTGPVTTSSTTVTTNAWATITANTQVITGGSIVAGGTVTLTGSFFTPNETGIQCTLNGVLCPLTPISPTVASGISSKPGTVTAANDGTWSASFTLPGNVTEGVNTFVIYGVDPSDNTRMRSYTTFNYSASPSMEVVNITVTPSKAQIAGDTAAANYTLAYEGLGATLGLPNSLNNAGTTWTMINAAGGSGNVATSFAMAIKLAVQAGINVTSLLLAEALTVFVSYTALQATINGAVISNIVAAVNKSSTDVNANAALILQQAPVLSGGISSLVARINIDPLAQTFTLPNDQYVSSIDLYFSAAPSSLPVAVAISNVNNGFPSGSYLSTCWKAKADINTTTNTRFTFDKPVFLTGGQTYAFVVLTNDSLASIWTANINQKDRISGNVITPGPAIGTALESPNAQTWQLLGGVDLQFQINTCNFSVTDAIVYLGSSTGLNTFSSAVSRFSTTCHYLELSTATKITFQYSADGVTWNEHAPALEIDLGGAFTNVYFRILMHGSTTVCPVLLNSPSIDGFIWLASGGYVHRSYAIPSGTSSSCDVYLDAHLPGGTSITPMIKFDSGSYAPMTLVSADTTVIDDNYSQYHYTYTSSGSHTLVAGKVVMASSQNYLTPLIRNFREIIS